MIDYFSQKSEEKAFAVNTNVYEDFDFKKKVEVNKIIKVVINNDDVFSFTILESTISYSPVWTGRRGKRFGYEKNYESEADPINNQTISDKSPLALAVLGKYVGDNFSYTINNITFTGKILSVE